MISHPFISPFEGHDLMTDLVNGCDEMSNLMSYQEWCYGNLFEVCVC